MVESDVAVECGGVLVNPGDLVFGDVDGVVVVPREREAEVLARAALKVAGENDTRAALLAGESLASVFARIGIL
jgi:regulator of RNase E activity RraA